MSTAEEYGELLLRSWQEAMQRAEPEESVCEPFAEYALDPVRFAQEVLGFRLWEGQRYILDSLVKHRWVSVRGSHKNGKSFSFAAAVLWAMCTAPTRVIWIMPVESQLRDIAFGALRNAHAMAKRPLPGAPDMLQWRLGPQHFVVGLSTNKPERAHGYHAGVDPPEDPDSDPPPLNEEELKKKLEEVLAGAGRMLIILDEAPGIPQFIYDGFRGTMASDRVLVLLGGNPVQDLDDDHFFVHSQKPGSKYHRIKFAAYKAPDPLSADKVFEEGFGPEGQYGIPTWICPPSWIEEQKAELGEDSPLFLGKVLGQFSAGDSSRKVITRELLVSALAAPPTVKLGRHMGVDLARYGADASVAVLWVDGIKRAEHEWRKADVPQSVEQILACMKTWAADGEDIVAPGHVHIDMGGMPGVVDRLRQRGFHVDGVDFGGGPKGDWRDLCGAVGFVNRRAELYWILRRAFQEGMAQLPEKYAASWREATWAEYEWREKTAAGTKILIEPKEAIKARHGRSPDHIDADVLAWARTGGRRVRFG